MLLSLAFSCQNSTEYQNINDFRPDILKQLDGEWIAKGNVADYILTKKSSRY
jgi:hypothetical protein